MSHRRISHKRTTAAFPFKLLHSLQKENLTEHWIYFWFSSWWKKMKAKKEVLKSQANPSTFWWNKQVILWLVDLFFFWDKQEKWMSKIRILKGLWHNENVWKMLNSINPLQNCPDAYLDVGISPYCRDFTGWIQGLLQYSHSYPQQKVSRMMGKI